MNYTRRNRDNQTEDVILHTAVFVVRAAVAIVRRGLRKVGNIANAGRQLRFRIHVHHTHEREYVKYKHAHHKHQTSHTHIRLVVTRIPISRHRVKLGLIEARDLVGQSDTSKNVLASERDK